MPDASDTIDGGGEPQEDNLTSWDDPEEWKRLEEHRKWLFGTTSVHVIYVSMLPDELQVLESIHQARR